MGKKTPIERPPTFFGERKWMLTHLSLVLSFAFALALPPTHAQTGERSAYDDDSAHLAHRLRRSSLSWLIAMACATSVFKSLAAPRTT